MAALLKSTSLLVAAPLAAAFAHLEPGSLASPKAGTVYAAGAAVRITWGQLEYHYGKYALSYSTDAGATWEPIDSWTGPSGDNITVHYGWTVPAVPTTAARVRVCQISNCREEEYVLTSGDFTIETGAPALRPPPAAEAALHFRPGPRVLDVAFSLDRPGRIVLRAFDAGGRLRATLLDGPHSAGSHRYSLPSPRLAAGPLLFRLDLGNKTVTEPRNALP